MFPTFFAPRVRRVLAAQLVSLGLSEEHEDLVVAPGSFLLENLHRVGFEGIVQVLLLLLRPGDFLTPATEMLAPRTHWFLQCHPVSDDPQGVYWFLFPSSSLNEILSDGTTPPPPHSAQGLKTILTEIFHLRLLACHAGTESDKLIGFTLSHCRTVT